MPHDTLSHSLFVNRSKLLIESHSKSNFEFNGKKNGVQSLSIMLLPFFKLLTEHRDYVVDFNEGD